MSMILDSGDKRVWNTDLVNGFLTR